jgi:hypothetical protein
MVNEMIRACQACDADLGIMFDTDAIARPACFEI